MPSLVEVASRTGFPFEASPSGRWVRFDMGPAPVYLVEGAWGNSYLVWAGEEGDGAKAESVQQFLRVEEALKAVLRLAS
jgi:hypothetical protein